MRTPEKDPLNFLTIDCPFCYKGKVEIVERGYNIAKQITMKTKSVKKCPICQGKCYLLLTKHE